MRWRQAANISQMLADFLDNLMAQRAGDRPLNTEVLLQRIGEIEQNLIKPVKTPQGATTPSITKNPSFPLAPISLRISQLYLKNTLDLECHSGSVNSVAISPDGQTLVSGSSDKTIKIWDLASGNLIRTLEGHYAHVSSVAISPDGQTLVSGDNDKTIKIWSV